MPRSRSGKSKSEHQAHTAARYKLHTKITEQATDLAECIRKNERQTKLIGQMDEDLKRAQVQITELRQEVAKEKAEAERSLLRIAWARVQGQR